MNFLYVCVQVFYKVVCKAIVVVNTNRIRAMGVYVEMFSRMIIGGISRRIIIVNLGDESI